jgi:hypothetical protein
MEIACVFRAAAAGSRELMHTRWIPCYDCGVDIVTAAERLGSHASPTPCKGGALKAG